MQGGRWRGGGRQCGLSLSHPAFPVPHSSASGDPFQELVDLSLYTLLRAFLRILESLHQGPKEQGDLRGRLGNRPLVSFLAPCPGQHWPQGALSS